jgi:hypothetical protein
MLYLGVAVFTWGLHGKLALYKQQSPFIRNSVVKLIQDDQPRKDTCSIESGGSRIAPLRIFRNVIEQLPPQFTVGRNQQVCKFVFQSILPCAHAFLVRPPPAIA